jgi:hypothetical protein
MGVLTYGAMAFTGTAVTTILDLATPLKALGSTTAGELGEFTMPLDNRLTYIGTIERAFGVLVSVSALKINGNSALATFHIAKNGAIVNLSIDRTFKNNLNTGNILIAGTVRLAENDYVELWVETDNGGDLTVEDACVVVSVLC